MSNGPEPRVRYGGSFELVSVRQGLIELELGDRLRIRRIEFGALIEPEVSLGWGAGGTQQRKREDVRRPGVAPSGELAAD